VHVGEVVVITLSSSLHVFSITTTPQSDASVHSGSLHSPFAQPNSQTSINAYSSHSDTGLEQARDLVKKLGDWNYKVEKFNEPGRNGQENVSAESLEEVAGGEFSRIFYYMPDAC